ncbi:MAG: DUF1738 domain-containing protein [Paucibacter sp.]|nr:DUF1738 domain-containing protein [Roseateles sp.]
MKTESRDLYASVTTQIIHALEAGTPPWICPWRRTGSDGRPTNAGSGRLYRGINVLLLNLRALSAGYRYNRWLTFRQALAAGGHVRRGEQGSPIVFFKMHEVEGPSSGAGEECKIIPLLRAFTVFNVGQIDGLAPEVAGVPEAPPRWDPIEEAQRLLEAAGAEVRHGGDRAFYAPDQDRIQLPSPGAFASAEDYYATALHELTHWTGHPNRCNRLLGRRHGIEAYAFEELVAEMGAAFLTGHCGLQSQLQHASYIAAWLEALRSDKRMIFAAAAQAQRAADFVLDDRGEHDDESAQAVA